MLKKMTPPNCSDGVIAISYRVLFTRPYKSFMGQPVVHLRWMVCPQPPHEQITVFVGQLVLDDEQCLVPLTVSVVLSVITDCPLQRPTIGDGEVSILALLELWV